MTPNFDSRCEKSYALTALDDKQPHAFPPELFFYLFHYSDAQSVYTFSLVSKRILNRISHQLRNIHLLYTLFTKEEARLYSAYNNKVLNDLLYRVTVVKFKQFNEADIHENSIILEKAENPFTLGQDVDLVIKPVLGDLIKTKGSATARKRYFACKKRSRAKYHFKATVLEIHVDSRRDFKPFFLEQIRKAEIIANQNYQKKITLRR